MYLWLKAFHVAAVEADVLRELSTAIPTSPLFGLH
jgi:hypothetical protein